jgi:hypothetical protein
MQLYYTDNKIGLKYSVSKTNHYDEVITIIIGYK